MDARLGLKVKFKDPENPANIISAQFATVRGHGEMKGLMEACARADVAESVELRRYSIAADRLAAAETDEELLKAADALNAANEARLKAGDAVLEAVHRFVARGFELAGATPDLAEQLSMLVGPEQLAELRVKCAFGAGVVDFTQAAAQ